MKKGGHDRGIIKNYCRICGKKLLTKQPIRRFSYCKKCFVNLKKDIFCVPFKIRVVSSY